MNSPSSRSRPLAPAGPLVSILPAILSLAAATVSGQDLLVTLPSVPSGFNGVGAPATGGFDTDIFGNVLDGFAISTSLSGTYDSNIVQGNVASEGVTEDDFILSLGTNLGYRTQGSSWTLGGNYNASYANYINNSDFSGFNQDFNLLGSYAGGRFSAIFTVGFDSNEGSNRIYQEFVEQISTTYNLSTRYQLSPKTSFNGTIGYSTTTVDQDFGDTSSLDLGLFGLWRATPLTHFGPGIRYALRTGDNQPDRTSIGPTLNLDYKLSSKVSLTSRFGVDFAEYEDGEKADPGFSTSIGLGYRASVLWGMNLSLVRDIQADPTTAGLFSEVTALRLGYNRKIRRAALNLGASIESSTSESADDSSGASRDRDYFSLDGSIGMPIFANTTQASIFTRFSDQSGEGSNSWSGYQLGFSLSRGF